jgi:nicotinamide riboside kinase
VRIAFCGPSGTGKTTLAQHVADLIHVPLNPIGSRSVSQAMGFASPYDVDKAGKRAEFQRRLIEEKARWEHEHESFVTDRTPLDNITYTIMHDVGAIDAALLSRAVSATRRYTLIIRCTMETFFAPGDDPARVLDPTYHVLFETVLEGLLARHARHVYTIESSALAARKYEVMMTVVG